MITLILISVFSLILFICAGIIIYRHEFKNNYRDSNVSHRDFMQMCKDKKDWHKHEKIDSIVNRRL